MRTNKTNTTNAGGRALTLGCAAALAAFGFVTMIARTGALFPVLNAVLRAI